jgi:hypothetical protein
MSAKYFQSSHPIQRTTYPMEQETGYPVFALSEFANGNLGTSVVSSVIKFTPQPGVEDRCVQTLTRVSSYYEVTINSKAPTVCISVGFASRPYPPFRLPGWEHNSIAFHSDTGNKFFNDEFHGAAYAQPYGMGDTIGCGYQRSGDAWNYYFTRNGKCLPNAYTTSFLNNETYGIVGADGDAALTVNFGDRPFIYRDLQVPPHYNLETSYGGNSTTGSYAIQPPTPQGQVMQQQHFQYQPQVQPMVQMQPMVQQSFGVPSYEASPNYNQVPPNYNQAPPSYDQAPPNYNQAPPNYNQVAPTYNQAPVGNPYQ